MTRYRPGSGVARVFVVTLVLIACAVSARAQQPRPYAVSGMVLDVDPSRRTFVVSHEAIPDLMAAMTMPFEVRESAELEGLAPGMAVNFTLMLGGESAYATGIRIARYESVEQDPLTARRLMLLKVLSGSTGAASLSVGAAVPDFTLTDQASRVVSLSRFRNKVVAINFIYTSCALPQFCFRIANHFDAIQKRFPSRMGRELVLLTIAFDQVRDTPERLAEYARQWNVDPAWHFLTGSGADVQRVSNMFGVAFFADEGLMSHTSRTVVIDRQGRLVANIEGNQYTAAQLGDLIATVLRR